VTAATGALPVRGPGTPDLPLPLPPQRMGLMRAGRPLKRWRYVGVYGPDLMLCIGSARVGVIPLRFWAVVEPGRPIVERTSIGSAGVRMEGTRVAVDAKHARIELSLVRQEGFEPIEVVSPAGDPSRGAFIWTRKEIVVALGTVEIEGRRHEIEQQALIDDSAGYHARHTRWKWSAGVGTTVDGERIAWNLVTGLHDAEHDSERTLWVEGKPTEVPPVRFGDELSSVHFADGAQLSFSEWAARTDDTNLLVFRSRYRQPFGTFRGGLPGGSELAHGYGVMEEHDVLW
jgi:hypothetical protein